MDRLNPLDRALPLWSSEQGVPIACIEKIKAMNENYVELQALFHEFLEDGVLMGCSEEMLRKSVSQMALGGLSDARLA